MARQPTKRKQALPASGPQRTCVACRRVGSPESFVRISVVRNPAATDDLSVAVGQLGGRGAWLCPTPVCVALLLKRRPLSRALRCEVPPDAYLTIADRVRAGVSTD